MNAKVRGGQVLCAWFALCENPAVVAVKHPVLEWVPTCQRCNDKHDLGGQPATWELGV